MGGAEALPLLLTLSSGVKGFTTIHAGSARQALTRLRFICQLADVTSELPMSALNSLVSESIDIVVHCARRGDAPQVTEVIAVEDLQTSRDSTAFTATDLFDRERLGAPLRWTGNVPSRVTRSLGQAGYDARALLDVFGPALQRPPATPFAFGPGERERSGR
jgi:pilus assembly protein CpaF